MKNQYAIPLSWRNVALVVVGGITLWLVPWLVWPSSSSLVRKTERRPLPVFRYIRAAQGLDGSTWSPVLMPLPTPDGFSKKAALKELPNKSLVSVLKPKISEPVYIRLEPESAPVLTVPSVAFLRPTEFNPEAQTKPFIWNEEPHSSPVIRFEIQEPLRYRRYEIPDMEIVFSNIMDQAAILMTADVELDKNGQVQHVLLEQPAGIPVVDSMIVRLLRSGRGEPNASNTWGRVRFFYWKNSSVQKE